jgi:hypothetical protein
MSAGLTAFSKSSYRSELDEKLTVRKISLLPLFDNLQGIYARPIEKHLEESLSNNHRFEYQASEYAGSITTPEELEEKPDLLNSILMGSSADALISGRLLKGPSGVSIKFNLFLASDKKLLAQVESKGLTRLDIPGLKKESEVLIKKLLSRLPYDGVVMSRQGTRVTLNLGRDDGLADQQVVSVIQIIKAERHPKFNFLISTEKEILGKIKIIKADPTLSFGKITTEKENGAIDVGSKIANLDDVVYGDSNTWTEGSDEDKLKLRPDGQVSFGDNPTEWLPQKTPTFGAVGARLGLGIFSENVTNSTETLDAEAPYYPFVAIEGEVWLTPAWTMHAGMRQGIISTENPKSGASPGDLSHSMSSYEFLMGYNLRMGASLWSPKVEVLGGFSTYRLYVDQSTPAGLSTKTYSGPKLGVAGSYPFSERSPYAVGANLFFFWDPAMKEEPNAPGNPDNDIKQFGLFLDQKIKINLKARYALDFELYSSKLSGGSSSQKFTNLGAGLYYMF